MPESPQQTPPSPRNGKGAIIVARPRVGRGTSIVLALAFAVLASPVVLMDSWLQSSDNFQVRAGEAAPLTIRIPHFSGLGADGAPDRWRGGQVLVLRGEVVSQEKAVLVDHLQAGRTGGLSALLAVFVGIFVLGLLYSNQLRRSHTGRLLRTQIVTFALILALALGVQVALMFSAMSVLIVPVAGLAIIAGVAVDDSVGMATGLLAAMLIAFLVPFDGGTTAVLVIQAFAAVLAISGRKHRGVDMVVAGAVGGIAAATAYAVFFYLSAHGTPLHELDAPLRSPWLATAAGGLLSGVLAVIAQPIYQFLLGEISKNKLVELEDLSNPLLKQIAEQSPGTWQHSLAMANMAEVAANSIGANGRLVRVGAYYHDLGKSLQPAYFIENLHHGEKSPHDRLPPEVSSDAIFAHVTEGVRVGRKEGLPERIVDFMHMHHGDGVLEYFWTKCQEQGNPKGLTNEDFRYPGLKPQTRETAILAIVDAVEAASRTLKKPDEHAIRNLVQRIVYGKLHLGQLDQSGISVEDLRKLANSLEGTIKHAFHGRIEYPWQKKEREQKSKDAQRTAHERPRAPSELAVQASAGERISATQRIIEEPPLDSLDVPRPYYSQQNAQENGQRAPTPRPGQLDAQPGADLESPESPASASSASMAVAATQQVADPNAETALVSAPQRDAGQSALSAPPQAIQDTPAPVEAPLPVETPPRAHEEPVPLGENQTILLQKRQVTEAAPGEDSLGTAGAIAPAAEGAAVPGAPQLAVWNEALQTVQHPSPLATGSEQRTADESGRTRSELAGAPAVSADSAVQKAVERRVTPPPPPGNLARPARSTIPLMGFEHPAGAAEAPDPTIVTPTHTVAEPARPDANRVSREANDSSESTEVTRPNAATSTPGPAPSDSAIRRTVTRASTEDDALTPGMMVLGPPPATHKGQKSKKRNGGH